MQEPLISLTAFQVIAILHALFGMLLGSVILQDDFKDFLHKKHSNPLTATIIYYLMLIGLWSLFIVGYVAVLMPETSKVAVVFSWLSLSTVFAASLVEFITYRSKPQFNKLSAVSVAIRTFGAYFLTITAPY